MEQLATGVTGAKRQSWNKANPRHVLKGIIEENPEASEEAIFDMFVERVRHNTALQDTIFEYWFANNFRSLVPSPHIGERRAIQQERTSMLVSQIKEGIERRARIVLLDMMLPHGKTLRDSTGEECAAMSQYVGAWLARLARKVGSNEMVGNVLTEEQVRVMYEV